MNISCPVAAVIDTVLLCVRLQIGQTDRALFCEMHELLNFYLGHDAPMTGLDKRTVSRASQRALCGSDATSSRLQLLFI